jgi:hypothetical protein
MNTFTYHILPFVRALFGHKIRDTGSVENIRTKTTANGIGSFKSENMQKLFEIHPYIKLFYRTSTVGVDFKCIHYKMKVKVKQEPHLGEWKVEVCLHSTPDGGELRASRPGHFTPEEASAVSRCGLMYVTIWAKVIKIIMKNVYWTENEPKTYECYIHELKILISQCDLQLTRKRS